MTGRWICDLCPFPVWVTGTYAEWLEHYQTNHQNQREDD